MPRPKISVLCENCRWSGELACNAATCPSCRMPFISRKNPESERLKVMKENRALREKVQSLADALRAAEAENHLLRQELDQAVVFGSLPPASDAATVFVNPLPLA